MRKKMLSKTYLRNVSKYKFTFLNDNDDYFLTIKKIEDIEKPFILNNGVCIMDKGYFIVELLPKNENYGMRVYVNDKFENVEYYFDITNGCGIDEESKIPYYDDLYLDVIVLNGEVIIDDQNELDEAFENGLISKETYQMAIATKNKLVEDLEDNKNKYFNLDFTKYLINMM